MNYLVKKTYGEIDYSPEQMKPLLENNKVVVLTDYDLDRNPQEFFTEFSDSLGIIFDTDENLHTGKATGNRWISISYDPRIKDKYRAAPVAQPLHTDASYVDVQDNIQFLCCESAAKLGGATTFIDSMFLVELLTMAGEDDLLKDLQNVEVVFSKAGRQRISPILRKDGDDWRLNWNYYCGDPDNSDEVKLLFDRFHSFLEERVVKSGLVTAVQLKRNDVAFFHDELVLHGRNSYFATEKGQRTLSKGTIILESRLHKNGHLNLTNAIGND